jgi:hypothetical protein
MKIEVEALRALNQWVRVDFGNEHFEIKGNFGTRYVIVEDEDRIGYSLITFHPNKNDLGSVIPKSLGSLVDIDIKELEFGIPVVIEGILPGATKSEMLRITQE